MMQRIVTLFKKETQSITLAGLLLAGASFGADILALVRDRILASQFGAIGNRTLDIYNAGFRIPDLLLSLLVLGAMSSAFLPVFAERFSKNKEDAWRLTANLLTLAGVMLVVFAGVLFFLIPYLMPLVAPGFEGEAMERAIRVTRILLLSPVLFGISSIVSAVLHYFQRFFLYSFAPILYNVGIIIGAVLFAPRFEEIGLAAGVILGAAMHLGVQLPGLIGSGFRFRMVIKPLHDAIREIVRLAVPRTANLVVNQIQLTVLTAIASLFIAGSITVFNFGNNLAFVPVGVIGVSFATAAFPALSRAAADNNDKQFSTILRRTIQEILFFALPAAGLFLVLRAHIVRVVLGAGAFSWEDTRLTAAVLGAFSLGVIAFSLLPLLVRAFFARKNTTTPLWIGTISAILTVGGTIALAAVIKQDNGLRDAVGALFRVADLADIRVLALPIAMSIVTSFQVLFLLAALRRYFMPGEFGKLIAALARLAFAALMATAATWVTLRPLAEGVAQETAIGIFLQGAVAGGVGILVFFFLAFTFAFPEAQRLVRFLKRSFPPLSAILPRTAEDIDDITRRGMEE